MQRIHLVILIAATLIVGAASLATQFVADVFDYQSVLGPPPFYVAGSPLYAPWSVFEWEARWGDDFPRPFAAARLVLLAGFVFAVLVVVLAQRRGFRPKPFGQDAWANFSDIEAADLFARHGAVLGKFDGEVLAYDGPEHQLLIGASRSGKGRGQVVPTLLAWPQSAIVLDVKGELADGDGRHGFPGTAGFRETLGPVLRFAPTRPDSVSFNPLFEVRRGADEVRDVQNIVEVIVDPAGETRHQDFWDRSAKQILVGVVLHVLYAEPTPRKTLAVVREKLRDLERTCEEMRTTLHRINPTTGAPEAHPEILHAAESFLAGEERLQSGVKATAESFFGLFADPIVAEKTATSDFRIADLMCGERPVTLYLQPPPSDALRLMPLMRLALNQIARRLMENQTHVEIGGLEKRHTLLLALDEFPQLGRMPFFETAMGAMAGYGIKVSLVCQSLNHITRAYGRDNVILDNCHIITAFAAADVETAKRIADMAGEVWEVRESETHKRPRPLLGARAGSATLKEERRPLLLASDVRALPRDEQLIFASGAKPIRAKKLKFDQERVFRERLSPASHKQVRLTTTNDWSDVRPLGCLAKDKKLAVRSEPPPIQVDLFEAPPSIAKPRRTRRTGV